MISPDASRRRHRKKKLEEVSLSLNDKFRPRFLKPALMIELNLLSQRLFILGVFQ